MKDKGTENQGAIDESLAPYYEAGAKRQGRSNKTSKDIDKSHDEVESSLETKNTPLSDEELRIALSNPPGLPQRRNIKDAADVIKRTYPELTKLQKKEDWIRVRELIDEDYFSGAFLIENLGAERYVETKVAMTLFKLRETLAEDMQIESTAEFMLLDCAFMAYYNTIKLQRNFGDLVPQTERELFHADSPEVKLKHGASLDINKFKVDEMLNRASDKLMNLIDRNNKMMVRNLKAIRELKSGTLSIKAAQVNIALQQVNLMGKDKQSQANLDPSEDIPGDSPTSS